MANISFRNIGFKGDPIAGARSNSVRMPFRGPIAGPNEKNASAGARSLRELLNDLIGKAAHDEREKM